MTKRKRSPPPSTSPSPSPPPHRRVVFEVPQSLWRFQAITRELARQSDLLPQQEPIAQEQPPYPSRLLPAGAPHFDVQTFQPNTLRFSPYLHQPFLPSQPWPEASKPGPPPTSNQSNTNTKESTAVPLRSMDGRLLQQERPARQISSGPEDQLFDELNDALTAEEVDDDPGPPAHYVQENNKIAFDPRLTGDWTGLRQDTFQPMLPHYLPMASPILQTHYPSNTSQQLPFHVNTHNILPSSPGTHPASFYPPNPVPSQNGGRAKPNMPGYYKSSLKLWSQPGLDSHTRPEGGLDRSGWPG